jgi:Transposase.
MASVFRDAKGILLIDCLSSGQPIMGQYYTNLLDQLQEKICEKMPGLGRKKVIFHQDNACPHTSVIAMTKVLELSYELLPYSPDLAPSDFHFFPKLKIFFGGTEIFCNARADIRSAGVFCRPAGISSRWDQGIGTLVDQMH